VSGKLFLLLEFLFDFGHFLTHAIIWAHRQALSYEFDPEYKEQSGGGEMGEAFREECRHSVTHDSREDCHDDQSGEGGREDKKSGVSHSHERRNEECLVSNLREDNHGEGKYEGMKGLYGAGICIIVESRRGCLGW
jgi:hypothetical protein